MKTFTAALAMLLVLPAVAEAKTYTLTGKFPSDAGTISLKVKTNKKGKPVSVSDIKAKRVRYRCPVAGPEGTPNPEFRRDITVAGKLKVKKVDSGRGDQFQFSKNFTVDGGRSRVFGVVSKNGKKVTEGDLSLDFKQNGNECANGLPGFTAKAK